MQCEWINYKIDRNTWLFFLTAILDTDIFPAHENTLLQRRPLHPQRRTHWGVSLLSRDMSVAGTVRF